MHAPPGDAALRLSALGEPPVLARLLMLSLQGYDNQKGVSVPLRNLDYAVVGEWLERIVALDERAEYPHFSAAKIYGVVNDDNRRRLMIEWVWRQFVKAPNERWEWMAFATNLAHYVLKDDKLALAMAVELREKTDPEKVPAWTRQLEIFFRENANEYEAAAEMLSRQLLDGEITDPHEFVFAYDRLEGMLEEMTKRGEIQSREHLARELRKLESLREKYLAQFEELQKGN